MEKVFVLILSGKLIAEEPGRESDDAFSVESLCIW